MSDLPVLDPAEQRVLGSLLEKEVTVPAGYPMTLNAIRTACSQQSSRDPVVDYDERQVLDVLRALKDADLVGVTWEDRGRRTMKYVQKLVARLGLDDAQRAVLTVLLLRGAQAPGALRSRTERLHAFADRDDVEVCLQAMAASQPPLVEQLPRAPREQDHRWVHRLGPTERPDAVAPSVAAVDREAVLADGAAARDDRVRSGYDTVAADYADALTGELDGLPFERWLLTRVAYEADDAPVVEVGTGPGHVAAYLADCGSAATGVDLSPAMIEQARARFPEVTYEVGDLRRLMKPPAHDGWGAVLAWYSLIHLAASELPDALTALVRPLRPGGVLVLALHAGSAVRHVDSWFDHELDGGGLDFVAHEPADVVALVRAAGLTDVEWYRRGPVEARGETTERLYVLARRPALG